MDNKEQINKFKNLMNEYHKYIGIIKTDKLINNLAINIQTNIEEILLELLPHGSGINCSWEFTWYKNGSLKCSNFYHAMNEQGSYVKFIPISIKFFRHKKNEYNFLTDKTKCQIVKEKGRLDYTVYAPRNDYYAYDLNNYLYETIWYLNYLKKDWYLKTINKNEIVE